jgi:hypothetical protein
VTTAVSFVIGIVAAQIIWALWSPPAALRRRTSAPPLPAQAERVDRLVRGGTRYAEGVHRELRPLLAEVVEPALARRGLALDGPEAPVRELLGEELWDLVRPRRPRPERPLGPGMERQEIERIVDRLEGL